MNKYYDATVPATATTLNVLANDSSGSAAMTITAITQPAHGSVTIAADGQSVSYLPTLDYCNHSLDPSEADTPADAFTYTVNGSATANVAVTVDAVDQAPISRQIYRDRGPQQTLLVPTSANVYSNKTADTITNSASSGPTTLDATDSTDPATCGASAFPLTYHWVITYLAPNQLLSNNYRDFGMTGIQSGALVIASNSLIPSVSPNSGAHFMLVITSSLTGMSSPTIDVQSYVISTTLTIQEFQACQQGSNACTATPAKPTADDTLAVDDGTTVPENPTANPTPASVVDVLANDTGPGTKVVTQATQPANGIVTIAPDGSSVSYLPNPGYCNHTPATSSADDTFLYTINGNSTATVTVEVDCVGANPTAVDDSATVDKGSGATTIDVLANDTNPDNAPIAIIAVTQPANGTVSITNSGADLSYQPYDGYCNTADAPVVGPDTFTYTITGGSTANVNVTVNPVNAAPSVGTGILLESGFDSPQVVTDPSNPKLNIISNALLTSYDASSFSDPDSCAPDNASLTFHWVIVYGSVKGPYADLGITGYRSDVISMQPNSLVNINSGPGAKFTLTVTSLNSGETTITDIDSYVTDSSLTLAVYNQCQALPANSSQCLITVAGPAPPGTT